MWKGERFPFIAKKTQNNLLRKEQNQVVCCKKAQKYLKGAKKGAGREKRAREKGREKKGTRKWREERKRAREKGRERREEKKARKKDAKKKRREVTTKLKTTKTNEMFSFAVQSDVGNPWKIT